MTGMTNPVQAKAAQEATDWFIALHDAPDDRDLRARFDVWCAQDPVHLEAWNATKRTADLMAGIAPLGDETAQDGKPDWQRFLDARRASEQDLFNVRTAEGEDAIAAKAEETAKIISAQSRFKKRGNTSWRGIGLGGVAIAASLVAAIIGPRIATEMQADHYTRTAEIRTITLADNSTVMLAPESAIKVHYDGKTRFVELLDGEAFFDVTPNPDQPFTVGADTVTVTVLGTGFDVSEGMGQTSVGVEHGLVRVDNAANIPSVSELLEPGQLASVTRDGVVRRSTTPISQIAPWRNNQLIAQDQPLGEIVDRLRRYYGGTILITDAALEKETVTGVYRLDDPVMALRGIARAQNAVVREITPWILVVSAS
ncbi:MULTISPECIES: FecR family protein [Thalassospira]|uniref:FecR domain-containing protein n=1 Tax=Thalassospira aquimaris TaxID=3037796 RepID=A0ABT6G817_9PROT|nr:MULTISPECIES: FecR domain-containing protein [Thalassospira]MDG4718037.1 FecR domain-containing protein [Thalassospira sp. FZY0004]